MVEPVSLNQMFAISNVFFKALLHRTFYGIYGKKFMSCDEIGI